jgi:ADP-ribose pyrophosphatase YjhB (NUDIX family)
MNSEPNRFCSGCGGRLKTQWVARDLRSRRVCSRCNTIAYQNPKVLISAIVAYNEKVLLCRRADDPARGKWTAPTGFLESGETLEEAAAREIWEETMVRVDAEDLRLYTVSTLKDIGEVYVAFRGEAKDPNVGCGPECQEVRYFSESELPWGELAYAEMAPFFLAYFRERDSGACAIHFSHLSSARFVRSTYRIAAVEASKTVVIPSRSYIDAGGL